MISTDEKLVCSFCGVSDTCRDYIIGNPQTKMRICDRCIDEVAKQLHYARLLAAHTQQQGAVH